MFNSIAYQIEKLDKELDCCKERLHALKISHASDDQDCVKLSKSKKVKRSRSAMNRKKVPAEKEYESACRKHCKVQAKLSEKCRRGKEISDSPVFKKERKVKVRSRSVSCGKECHCDCISENNYLHNDLGPPKPKQEVTSKNSWGNILKECNVQTINRNCVAAGMKPQPESDKAKNPASVYLKNRGVQCSEGSFVPSRSASGLSGFTPYNPTRTLHFLLSEIRDNIKHNREDKVLNIINDMEDTIYRLKSNPNNMRLEDKKLYTYNSCNEPVLNNKMDYNQDVNKVFEEGFAKLEGTCKTLEMTCARLKEENKQLQLEVERKDSCICLLEKKEKEHLEKINVLNDHIMMISRKGEQSSETIKELTKLLSKVQQDIKCIEPLKESNAQLECKLTRISEESSNHLYENQILKLENEKLKVLLEIKEKQLFNYQHVFCGLEEKVRTDVNVMQDKCKSEDSDIDSSAPLCSSPNTSGSILAPAYGSWRGMSRVSSNPDGVDLPPCDFDCGLTDKEAEQLVENAKGKLMFKSPASPQENHREARSIFDNPPKNQLGGIEGLRGQIKMLFSDRQCQAKAPTNNPNSQLMWKNLNTIHSSVTSYNTTT